MYKSCSKCGKVHPANYRCRAGGYVVKDTEERKLRSRYDWTKKSLEIRERANYLCEVCRAEGRYTYEDVEVHHIVKLREDREGLLDNYNLVCLCQEHHRQADAGEIEADYLRRLARDREGK